MHTYGPIFLIKRSFFLLPEADGLKLLVIFAKPKAVLSQLKFFYSYRLSRVTIRSNT